MATARETPCLPEPAMREPTTGRRRPRRSVARRLSAAAMTAGFGLGSTGHAQEPADYPSGWSFQLTPYAWLAGLKGDVAVRSGLPTVPVDASFSDILENTDIALMLAAEARRGRMGLVTDLVYLGASADGDTPGPLFGAARAEVDTLFATVSAFYRAFAGEAVTVDALAGARIWYVDLELELDPGRLPGRTTQGNEVWADPVVGLRWNAQLGRGFFVAGAADIGGFDVGADFTWQLLGTLGYRVNDWLSVRAGYRHLEVDYEHDGFVFDVEMSGPIMGASFRF